MIAFALTLVLGVGGAFALACAADHVLGRLQRRWRDDGPRRAAGVPRSCVRVLAEPVDWERKGWA